MRCSNVTLGFPPSKVVLYDSVNTCCAHQCRVRPTASASFAGDVLRVLSVDVAPTVALFACLTAAAAAASVWVRVDDAGKHQGRTLR